MGQVKEQKLKQETEDVDELIRREKIEKFFPAPRESWKHRGSIRVKSGGDGDDRSTQWSDYLCPWGY